MNDLAGFVYGSLFLAPIIVLLFVLAILIFTLFYDGLCDKYGRAFDQYGLDYSKRQIVEKVFGNFTDEDKIYILREC